jgi:hypothetical protein
MIGGLAERLRPWETEESIKGAYERYMLSLKINVLDSLTLMIQERCSLYEAKQPVSPGEGEKEEIDNDCNLKNSVNDFLISNQALFEKYDVQCGDRVEKAHECQRKLVKMEKEYHNLVVEEKSRVMSIDNFTTSEPMEVEEITHVKRDAFPYLRWESLNLKKLTVNAWEHLILYAKFMEFLPSKRKTKGDIFLLSFLPP